MPSSVPVDDAQMHCALSGERFEQFWDDFQDKIVVGFVGPERIGPTF
jgi:hypothetical protein